MTPIRIDGSGVEPVSLSEMRAFLRIDLDDTGEDVLVARLIATARAKVETEARRVLVPGRFRLIVPAWPGDGLVPLPLSPLVAVERLGLVDAAGTIEEFDAALLRLGPDPWEAPCLHIGLGLPPLGDRTALIELRAGCGGDGPSAPEPLVQAIRLCVAAWFEKRGDAEPAGPRGIPADAAGLIAPHRLLRL